METISEKKLLLQIDERGTRLGIAAALGQHPGNVPADPLHGHPAGPKDQSPETAAHP